VNPWAFLARFAAWAALYFVLWAGALARWYAAALAALGPYVTVLATGFEARVAGTGRALVVHFVRGSFELPHGLPLEPATLGILPFLALVATSRFSSVRGRVRAFAVGLAGLFAFHLTLFAAYPFFMTRRGMLVDSIGAFCAILGFCGLPFLLWLALARNAGAPKK